MVVRNVTVLGSVDIEKMTTDSLVEAARQFPEEAAGGPIKKSGASEGQLCLKPSDRSLYYSSMPEKWAERCQSEEDENSFVLNLISAPGPVEISSESTPSFCLADGALVLLDWMTGMSTDLENLLTRAIVERVKPIYTINMDGPSFLMLPSDGEMVYRRYCVAIDKANSMLETYQDKLLADIRIRPDKGTCGFSCISYNWAFTLTGFAKFYAPKFGLSEKKMREKLWGDHFFDTTTEEWTCKNTGSPTCKRGFVLLCLDPIREAVQCCMEDNASKLASLLKRFSIKLKASEHGLKKDPLLKCVMQIWTPLSSCLLELMFCHLPSPVEAQLYRVENLYKGPLNDVYATSIRNSDPHGPLILYIAKVVTAGDNNIRSFALGRVYSGQLKHGMKVRLLRPNHRPGQREDLPTGITPSFVDKVEAKGGHPKIVIHGSIAFLIGLDVIEAENATVTGFYDADACPIRPTQISLFPCATDTHQEDVTLQALGATSHQEYHVPYSIYNQLYLHQREAMFWLWSIHCQNTGAILADDMGLGKTREVAAFLAGLIHSGIISTALIMAPCSVVDEWPPVLELVHVTSRKYLGTKDVNNLQFVVENGGVLVTSYDVYRLHLSKTSQNWGYVFLDEGHRIKNSGTLLYKSLKSLKTCHKIIITGTPFQNNLLEFHTIMTFCNPNLLGNLDDFKRKFISPIDQGKFRDVGSPKRKKYSIALKELKILIRPYVLRRTKQLLKEQGRLESEKHEILVWVHLSALQIQLYKKLVLDEDEIQPGEKDPLLAARIAEDICNHPQLLLNEYSGSSKSYQEMKERMITEHNETMLRGAESSSKLIFLIHLVSKLVDQKHKILIFAQSPRILKIIESALINVVGEETMIRMDGTTPMQERRYLIQTFQASVSSPPLIFLLTSKVGGVGVTLTKASRVIIFDPSKNPSDDDQSVDRAYRIGQEKDILVYRLVTCGTIEEYRYRQKILKGETSCSVLGVHQCKKGINKQDRKVLTLPLRGFGYCQTEKELATIYGDHGFNSDLRTDIDFIKTNKSVVGLTNHGRLFSLEEDIMEDETWLPRMEFDASIADNFKGKQIEKTSIGTRTAKARKPIDEEEGKKDKIGKYRDDKLGKQVENRSVETQTVKARQHIDEEEDEMKNIRLYISSPVCFKLLTGKLPMTMEHICTTSGACIKRMQEFNRTGEQCLQISGSHDQVEVARRMLMKVTK